MGRYRFSWDAFDDDTLNALAEAWGYDPDRRDGRSPRDWLGEHAKRPTPEFVQATKAALERTWLPNYPGARQFVERLIDQGIGPMGRPRSQKGYVDYIRACRNSGTIRGLLAEALIRFGDRDRDPGSDGAIDGVAVPRFALLKTASQPEDSRRPYPHQEDAWRRLSAHLAEAEATGVFEGLLVMPTGSGKTFTAARWLAQNALDRGQRVLWLAHRHELLEQAAEVFHQVAGLAARREQLRIRIVSGQHCAASQIDPADDVLVCSVASLTRRPDIVGPILGDPRTFLVVDEAHHAPARSYRDLIEPLRSARRRRILGLTATPTRTAEGERALLAQLFGGRVIYQVGLTELIERGILARPIPEQVTTRAEVEEGITRDDEAHLTRFGDLSEAWLDRIAHMERRNQVILDRYLKNRIRYGKTLVFAINVAHAVLLTDRLRAAGVAAEYIASHRDDDGDNKAIIGRFRDPDGGLEVLVNVMILTEGVDLPSVKAVLLTRPTSSEVLMRQMVGRALRGPKAGGTEEAFLVAFEDQWRRFREWLSPLDLLPDLVDPQALPDEGPASRRLADALPWDLIKAVAARMRETAPELKADCFEAVPHGWYVLARDDEGESVRRVIPVYAHQAPCWEALVAHLERLTPAALAAVRGAAAFDEYFADCEDPIPAEHQVGQVLEHVRHGGGRPEYHELAERRACDPAALARQVLEEDLGERAKTQLLERQYTSLARAIYPSLREFRSAVEDALFELQHPDQATGRARAVPIFDPRPDQQLTPGPHHDLGRLMAAAREEARPLLGVPKLPTWEVPVAWTRRLVKGWYGMAHWEPGGAPGQGRIRINRLLDSPDVPAAVVRFLLWHEYLHLYLRQGHTRPFRELERRWPGMVEADRFLDTLNERFGVQYW